MLLTYFSLSFTLLIILSFYAFFIGFVDEYDTIEKIKKNAGIIEERQETFDNMNDQLALPFDKKFSNEYTYILYNNGKVKGLDKDVTTINYDTYKFNDLTNKDVVALCVGNNIKKIYGPSTITKWELKNGILPNLSNLIFLPGGTDDLFIYYRSFAKSKISEIILPERTKLLGEHAFTYCENLKTIYIPHNIRLDYIQKACFRNCKSLTHLYIPTTIKGIHNYAFVNCTNLDFIICSENLLFIDSFYYDRKVKKYIKQKPMHFYNTKLAKVLNKVTNKNNVIFALNIDNSKKQFYATGLINNKYQPQIYKYIDNKKKFKFIQNDDKEILNLQENAVKDSYMFLNEMNKNLDNKNINQFILSGYHQLIPFETDTRIPKQPDYNDTLTKLIDKNIPLDILNINKKDENIIKQEVSKENLNVNSKLKSIKYEDEPTMLNVNIINPPNPNDNNKPIDKNVPVLNDNVELIKPAVPLITSDHYPINDPIKKDPPNDKKIFTIPNNPPIYAETPSLNPPRLPQVNLPKLKNPPPSQVTIDQSKKIEISKEIREIKEEERKQIQSERNAKEAEEISIISEKAAEKKGQQLKDAEISLQKQQQLKKQAEEKFILAKDIEAKKKAEEISKKANEDTFKKNAEKEALAQQKKSADRIAKLKKEEADILKEEAERRKEILNKKKEERIKKEKEKNKKVKEKREKQRKKASEEYLKAKKEREEQERKRKEAEKKVEEKEKEHQQAKIQIENAEKARKKAQEEEKMRKAQEERKKEEEAKTLAREAELARIKAEREEMLKKMEEERIKKEKEEAILNAIKEKNLEDAKKKVEEDAKKNNELWDAFIAREEENERSIDTLFINKRPKQSSGQKLNTNMFINETNMPLGGEQKTIEMSQDVMNCEKRIFSDTDPKGWTCAAPMPTKDLNFMFGTDVKYHDTIEDIKAQKPDSNLELNKEYIFDDIGNRFEYSKATQQNDIKYQGIGKYKYGYENYIPKYHETVIISDLTENAKKEANDNLEKLNNEYSFNNEIYNNPDNEKIINNFISPHNQLILPKKKENIFDYNSNIDSFNKNNVIWSLAQQDNLFNN